MINILARNVLLGACSLLLALPASAETPQSVASRVAASAAANKSAADAQMVLEPRAVDIIKAMATKLADAQGIKFSAVVSEESPSRLGPALVYTTRSDVVLQRPNKLKIITPADGPANELYYDGKTLVAYSPAEDFAAIAAAPPTITGALKFAFDTAAIYYPFTDLIVDDPYEAISSDMKLAFYIGQSNVIGDTTTDMIAYANEDVFVQAWIGTEDKLPRKMRAVFADDPLRLRHEVTFSDWALDSVAKGESFASDKAAKAKQIPFARPDQKTQQKSPAAASPAKGGKQ
jgi:hypothetical protein